MGHYTWKPKPETLFFLAVTFSGPILNILYTTDFEAITDWRGWLFGLVLAGVRPTIGAIIAMLPKTERPEDDTDPFSGARDNLHSRVLTLAAGVERAQQMGYTLNEADLAVIVDAMLVEAQRLDALEAEAS
jgi:hypothetical protein